MYVFENIVIMISTWTFFFFHPVTVITCVVFYSKSDVNQTFLWHQIKIALYEKTVNFIQILSKFIFEAKITEIVILFFFKRDKTKAYSIYTHNSWIMDICIQRTIVLTLKSALLCLWLNKKCNEVRNGLRMSQVGPDLHRLGWRGWCVVRGR
jgi:hypothetical protein